jgi:ribosomal protein L11 methyltransferase
MAFGTGHHQTTTMMMEYILTLDFTGKTVLDMGCGTGILAFLAAKKGAFSLTAIDYDQVCYESTVENAALNEISNIEIICGGKEAIPAQSFDIILANINRNILLDQIPVYAKVLDTGGEIIFSGFYESPDLSMIKEACAAVNIHYLDHKKIDDWVAARFLKN